MDQLGKYAKALGKAHRNEGIETPYPKRDLYIGGNSKWRKK
ncbi:MAG: hypothetical protein V1835_03965 [Candidatus Micrarchaeota archaeon]